MQLIATTNGIPWSIVSPEDILNNDIPALFKSVFLGLSGQDFTGKTTIINTDFTPNNNLILTYQINISGHLNNDTKDKVNENYGIKIFRLWKIK